MIRKERFMSITAASLEKYLLFKEWKRDNNFKNEKLMVFGWEGESLVIPASEKYKDFYMVLPDVITTLAEIYNKPVSDIIKEITTSYYDWLEFRIMSKISECGELPLGYASNCIEGLKELILYSACAEQHQEPICLRTTNNAKEVLDNFKLAQTDVGSFIINIDIKVVDEEYEQLTLPDCEPDIPAEHKIVRRIGEAIQQIDRVTKDEIQIDDLLPIAYKHGATANMCEALMKLKPANADAKIETKIRYASAVTKRIDDVESVNISGEHFYVMNEIAKRYRNAECIDKVSINGAIKGMHKNVIAQHRYYREISIISFMDGKYHTIKAELGEEDYKLACDAHRDEQIIEICGYLDKHGKIWKLEQIENFRIIEQ